VAGSLRLFPYGCYVPCVMLAGSSLRNPHERLIRGRR